MQIERPTTLQLFNPNNQFEVYMEECGGRFHYRPRRSGRSHRIFHEQYQAIIESIEMVGPNVVLETRLSETARGIHLTSGLSKEDSIAQHPGILFPEDLVLREEIQ